ncbi:MAG TPA: hypothetical protein VF157_11860 [Chloroflexota bacterium]
MAEAGHDWAPTDDDLAYWRFLRLARRPLAAHLCLKDGTATMWARPREPFMRQAFWTKHAGHEHVFIADVLDRCLQAKHQS